jgi:TDG/mug DNA glycosylase family protein
MIVRMTRPSIRRSQQGDQRSSKGDPPGGSWRPTKEQLEAARGKGVRDVIAPQLRVLFCGINPGLYTAAIGHHFGRPGNRFWTALHAAGFTDRLLSPFEERELPDRRVGITNLVNKATRVAEELDADDLRAGAKRLEAKVRRYRPRILAVLGLGAYRIAFGRPRATIGEQPERIGRTRVWVLPNPSGRTASYQLGAIADLLREVRRAGAGRSADRRSGR